MQMEIEGLEDSNLKMAISCGSIKRRGLEMVTSRGSKVQGFQSQMRRWCACGWQYTDGNLKVAKTKLISLVVLRRGQSQQVFKW